jgi:hypothetical protein
VIAGVSTILFALASFLTSNLGGFLLGMLRGLVGGSLAVGWDVDKPKDEAPAEQVPAGDQPSDGDDVRGLDLVRPEDAGRRRRLRRDERSANAAAAESVAWWRGDKDQSLAAIPASGQVSDGTATR